MRQRIFFIVRTYFYTTGDRAPSDGLLLHFKRRVCSISPAPAPLLVFEQDVGRDINKAFQSKLVP